MIPAHPKQAVFEFGPPEGHPEVSSIWAKLEDEGEGEFKVPTVTVYWQPSPEEIMKLAEGGLVAVMWYGNRLAPHVLEVVGD